MRSSATPAAWLRIERKGGQVIGSTSADGQSWTWTKEISLTLPNEIYVGIATDGADRGDAPFLVAQPTVCDIVLDGKVVPPTPDGPLFRRGDADSNGSLELTDAVSLLNFLFTGGGRSACLDAADFDDDGEADISDAIASLNHQFLGGPPPAAPGAINCGGDPRAESPDLTCAKGC